MQSGLSAGGGDGAYSAFQSSATRCSKTALVGLLMRL
jgi:hypothetical protein